MSVINYDTFIRLYSRRPAVPLSIADLVETAIPVDQISILSVIYHAYQCHNSICVHHQRLHPWHRPEEHCTLNGRG